MSETRDRDGATPGSPPSEHEGSNFIRALIAEDTASGKYEGRVVTRFPPEPNGYLHIGHAKSIWLNFTMAAEHDGGRCHLRFDDTNPSTEETEYVEAIERDVRWLGYDWGEHEYFASSYFEQFYALAVRLIEMGKAYVDSSSEAQVREQRGTLTTAGTPSTDRERSVQENLDLLRRMRAGEFADSTHVLRAKIDLGAANMKMRDPLLYRIRKAHHHRTGDAWCIYPMYDFAHCLEDAIEGVTHSLCTLEFENNRDIYDWVLDTLGCFPARPYQTEFARLEITYMITSKRKLLALVRERTVAGWDNPRLPTLAGLRRRGYTPEAIRSFCERVGVAKANSVVDIQLLEHYVRDDLNVRAPRVMCVLRPLRLVVESYAEDEAEWLDASYWPHDVPKTGSRKVPFTRELYIEHDDFQRQPEPGFHRLAPGREVRLRYAYLVTCREVIEDPTTGEVVELRCVHDPATRGGHTPDGRKVASTIHWVSARHALDACVDLYDRLFTVPAPGADGVDFRTQINPNSLMRVERAKIEPSIATDAVGPHYQFERLGYFVRDAESEGSDRLVFNRTVALRDSWAKIARPASSPTVDVEPTPSTVERRETGDRAARPKKRSRTELRRQILGANPQLAARERRYVAELGIDAAVAEVLTASDALADFFETAVTVCPAPAVVAKWIANEFLGELGSRDLGQLPFGGATLGRLVALVVDGTISGRSAKDVLVRMIATGEDPQAIVEREGLRALADPLELQRAIDDVLAASPSQLAGYHAGQVKLFGYFVGRVMQVTEGRASPELLKELLRAALDRS